MKKILNNKLLFIIPFIIIMLISFGNQYNARLLNNIYKYNLYKQIIWYILGFIIIIIINKVNIDYVFKYSKYLYYFGILLLILVLFIGKNINGSKAWISIFNISIEPSEIMKLFLLIYLTNISNSYKYTNLKNEILFITKLIILTLIPSILVFLEPDTGAIIFYLIILFTIIYVSNIRKRWFYIGISFLIIILLSIYYLYTYKIDLLIKILGNNIFYRFDRLINFKNNYQLENALIVMGTSSLFGTGLNKISLYIPEAPTDFIFAFAISNFGNITGFIILISYILIDIYFINKLFNNHNKKIKLFLSSFINIFIIGQIINIYMNIGLLPIIGLPLPFLSYGGSTIIIYFTILAIVFKMLKSAI